MSTKTIVRAVVRSDGSTPAAFSRSARGAPIDFSAGDPVAVVREVVPDGVDWVFEAIGLKATVEQAVEMLGRGGAAVIMGVPADRVKAEVEPLAMVAFELRMLGCNYGSSDPAADFPKLLGL